MYELDQQGHVTWSLRFSNFPQKNWNDTCFKDNQEKKCKNACKTCFPIFAESKGRFANAVFSIIFKNKGQGTFVNTIAFQAAEWDPRAITQLHTHFKVSFTSANVSFLNLSSKHLWTESEPHLLHTSQCRGRSRSVSTDGWWAGKRRTGPCCPWLRCTWSGQTELR